MPTLELLSPEQHRQLRMRPADTSPPHFVQVLVSEFAGAATCCPVLFSKEAATGKFFAGAMFGMQPGENLLGPLDPGGAFYPLTLQRAGFFLSGHHVAIDRAHPRFSEDDGEPLFDAGGEPGSGLRRIQSVLAEIRAGVERTDAFIAMLVNLRLIEPIDITLTFKHGERLALQGLYTVSLDRLGDLDDVAALGLFRAGYLQLSYTMIASLKQIQRLAGLRNLRS